jgi:ectoine hydroxylase-related dioxygenase (phytanoyl-CoA dioxygenase family)
MEDFTNLKEQIEEQGFIIIPDLYSDTEIDRLVHYIEKASSHKRSFRKSEELFAIRQLIKELPGLWEVLYTEKLRNLLKEIGEGYFLVKSIYFDKPGGSNWFVAYHQDLMISVNHKASTKGFGPWTVKQDQFAVQPPVNILEQNFTVRIHLDDTDRDNGALRVIPKSHNKGIYRAETIDWNKESEVLCDVPKGGVMVMKPLLLHASSKSTSKRNRRVIHLEFSNQSLPAPLQWAERREATSHEP